MAMRKRAAVALDETGLLYVHDAHGAQRVGDGIQIRWIGIDVAIGGDHQWVIGRFHGADEYRPAAQIHQQRGALADGERDIVMLVQGCVENIVPTLHEGSCFVFKMQACPFFNMAGRIQRLGRPMGCNIGFPTGLQGVFVWMVSNHLFAKHQAHDCRAFTGSMAAAYPCAENDSPA